MGEDPIASEATTSDSIPDPVADGTKNDISDGATKDPAENAVAPKTEEPKDDTDASHGGPPLPVYIPPGSNELPVEERVAKPGVRYYNYQGYNNRLNSDGEDFGIEVLITGTDWHEETEIEFNKRWEPSAPPPVAAQPPATTTQQPEQPTADVSNPPPKQPSPPLHVENPTLGFVPRYIRKRVSEYLAADPLEKKYSFSDKIEFSSGSESILEGRIMRIRVRNPTIIAALGAASGYGHLSSDNEMKKKLAEMESIHSESVSSSDTALAEVITLASGDTASPEEPPKTTSELTPGEVAPEGKEEGLQFTMEDLEHMRQDRSGGNLERNALVGVFLRVLEYYSGILFMTTNRVGALDEAFQSRVHLSLFYPNLSRADTIEILRFNLNRLPRINKAEGKTAQGGYLKIFDKKIIEQIRNAVQIAAGLALYEKQTGSGDNDDEDDPPYLTAEHFRAVADMTYEFEDYLSLAGKGDAQVQATRRRDRADQFYGSQGEDQLQEVDMEVIGVTILPLELAVTYQVQELPSAETAALRLDLLECPVKISAQTRGHLLETMVERQSTLVRVRVKFPALL
ncbi:putative cell division cycle ATPase [Colletotrichum sp. SAR 10_76]|nr:putative cell division cycle ATPase [Colletotrichum sp. SAR 10_75]KAI8206466.1 putative cell division cycle ATPase [Colletotrichum sp. SAR 10_76]